MEGNLVRRSESKLRGSHSSSHQTVKIVFVTFQRPWKKRFVLSPPPGTYFATPPLRVALFARNRRVSTPEKQKRTPARLARFCWTCQLFHHTPHSASLLLRRGEVEDVSGGALSRSTPLTSILTPDIFPPPRLPTCLPSSVLSRPAAVIPAIFGLSVVFWSRSPCVAASPNRSDRGEGLSSVWNVFPRSRHFILDILFLNTYLPL